MSHLKIAGYKLTPQRLAICKVVLKSKSHPSAEMIYKQLQQDYPTISLATVYKTFHLLQQIGLIQEVSIDDGKIRFDPNQSLHINLICTKCGVIKDYTTEFFAKHWTKIMNETGIVPTSQLINLYYECDLCKNKK
jgi:Fur family peroxide stress response transcriptional regulator